MNREDIIRMAREVGFFVLMPSDDVLDVGGVYPDADDEISKELQHFAQLVAAAEREACAKECESLNLYGGSESRQLQLATLKDCAYAIRARGEK